MRKIILLVAGFILTFSSMASASGFNERVSNILTKGQTPNIAVVLAGDQRIFTEKRIAEEIKKSIDKKFPKTKYNVVEDKKVYQELLIIAEGRDDVDVVTVDQLKQKDFIAAGKKYAYDYVIVLPFYNEGGYYTTSGWTNMVSQNITLKARIVDVNKGEYLYRLDVTKQGEAGNAFGSPSFVRAQKEAIIKCLEDVFADLEIGEKIAANNTEKTAEKAVETEPEKASKKVEKNEPEKMKEKAPEKTTEQAKTQLVKVAMP